MHDDDYDYDHYDMSGDRYVAYAMEAEAMNIGGRVYQAESGQWSWEVYHEENGPIVAGAGYESEEDAEDELDRELLSQRRKAIKAMFDESPTAGA